MKSGCYAAVDLGATSGRVTSGFFDGSKLCLGAEYRFPNIPVRIHKTLYWDILGIYRHVAEGLTQIAAQNDIMSVGVDTWGNDFALFDRTGRMLENAVHYRDEMTKGMPERLQKVVPMRELYNITGIQHMRVNGLYKLYAMSQNDYSSYRCASRLLMIPDIMTYFLTGEMINEYTNASTTQMLCAKTGDWAYGMLERLGINTQIFSKPVVLSKAAFPLADRSLYGKAKLAVIGTHDTACAVAAVPCVKENFIYISSGTWSLVGTETDNCIISETALKYNLTNEGGVFGKNRLLKNVMGMWILEELIREWKSKGISVSYESIMAEAKKAKPYAMLIDPDDPQFIDMGDMSEKVDGYLMKTGQTPPRDIGSYARCLFDSLAIKYTTVMEQITKITGKRYEVIHIVGGGSKNTLLNQIVADVSGLPVAAGPAEATTTGNILTQASVCGEIAGLAELRDVSARSSSITVYEPSGEGQAREAYDKFENILRR